jgi:exodeoxyribonuclease VII large subunit
VELAGQSYVFREPGNLVKQYRQQVDELLGRASLLSRHRLQMFAQKVQGLRSRLESLDPEGVLARGYSITLDPVDGTVVSRVAQATIGKQLRTLVNDGSFLSRVTDVRPGEVARRGKSNERSGREEREEL